MNELPSPYDSENYHIAQTHSLYVRLDQHKLRLSRPKYNIARRAMFDESVQKPEFIHQRHYDMRGSKVGYRLGSFFILTTNMFYNDMVMPICHSLT